MDRPANSVLPLALSAVAGFVVCLAVTLATGKKEAWDSSAYFVVGIPVMCVFIFALSWKYPEKAWRWVLGMAFGQSIAMLMGGGSLALWPLSIVAMTILSLPQWAAAIVASNARRRRIEAGREPGG